MGTHQYRGSGQFNGYVTVNRDHPWFGKTARDIDCDIHGGVTYAKQDGDDWTVGFNTSHFGDSPELWNYEAVCHETKKLYDQAVQVADFYNELKP